jgi:hypothetical protein
MGTRPAVDPGGALMSANITAIALSVIALGISTWLAVRQALLSKRANHLPAYLHLLSEFRSREFNDHYLYVCEKLAGEHDSELGISGLPNNAREAVYDIAYYYQEFAILILTRIVDEDVVLAFFHWRIIRVWEAISPYVSREREISKASGDGVFGLLEEYAVNHERRLSPESLITLLSYPGWKQALNRIVRR